MLLMLLINSLPVLCFDPNQEAIERLKKTNLVKENNTYENKKDFKQEDIRVENFNNRSTKYLSDKKNHLYREITLDQCIEDQLNYSHLEDLSKKELSALTRQRLSSLIPKFDVNFSDNELRNTQLGTEKLSMGLKLSGVDLIDLFGGSKRMRIDKKTIKTEFKLIKEDLKRQYLELIYEYKYLTWWSNYLERSYNEVAISYLPKKRSMLRTNRSEIASDTSVIEIHEEKKFIEEEIKKYKSLLSQCDLEKLDIENVNHTELEKAFRNYDTKNLDTSRSKICLLRSQRSNANNAQQRRPIVPTLYGSYFDVETMDTNSHIDVWRVGVDLTFNLGGKDHRSELDRHLCEISNLDYKRDVDKSMSRGLSSLGTLVLLKEQFKSLDQMFNTVHGYAKSKRMDLEEYKKYIFQLRDMIKKINTIKKDVHFGYLVLNEK